MTTPETAGPGAEGMTDKHPPLLWRLQNLEGPPILKEAAAEIVRLSASPLVGDGWRLVPEEPDKAMHEALTALGRALVEDPHERDQWCWFAIKAYRAMIAAAPLSITPSAGGLGKEEVLASSLNREAGEIEPIGQGFPLTDAQHAAIAAMIDGQPEMIVAAAIDVPGYFTTVVERPGRHGNLIHPLHQLGLDYVKRQGFLTNRGRFVDRDEAAQIAEDAGQTTARDGCNGLLFSEDCWNDDRALSTPNPEAGENTPRGGGL